MLIVVDFGINKIFLMSSMRIFKSTSLSYSDLNPALEYSKTLEINCSIVSNVIPMRSKFCLVVVSKLFLLSVLIHETKASILLKGVLRS